jgi:hypothetical protein
MRVIICCYFSLLVGCSPNNERSEIPYDPYFQAKPRIPARPNNFCVISRNVLLAHRGAANFVCRDYLQGAYAAQVDVEHSRIVFMQGASEEWFFFAYSIASDSKQIGNEDLENSISELEAKFREAN